MILKDDDERDRKKRDDDEKPKKSWRDVDRGRDRSRHVSGEPRKDAPWQRERSHQARAALERAFSDGLVSKFVSQKEAGAPTEDQTRRPQLLKKIRVSESRAEVNAAIDELLAFSGFPDDWDVLVRALDHNRDAVVLRALEHIEELLGREVPPRKGALGQRLVGLIAMTLDDDVRALAERVRSKLG
jgi:hypothetical protein